MIDPLNRWSEIGEKPDYAGLVTFAGSPYTEDASELQNADVAIVGAPMDDLVSDRPGTCFAPRAIRAASCPPGPHLEVGVDAFEELRVVDFGDAAVVPTDARRTHAAIEALIGEVLAAGTVPFTLGGDHSITEPCARACAAVHGRVGMVHFDTHTDTAEEVLGPPSRTEPSCGTWWTTARWTAAATRRSACAATGRGRASSPGRLSTGSPACSCTMSATTASRRSCRRAVEAVGEGPAYLTVDIDVLDPAFVPGTGTPEPGGLASADLLWAVREVASRIDLVGADLVEVIPTQVGTADYSALVGDRIVREILTGSRSAAAAAATEPAWPAGGRRRPERAGPEHPPGFLALGGASLGALAGCDLFPGSRRARAPAGPTRPNVVLVIVDTLRADHVYGPRARRRTSTRSRAKGSLHPLLSRGHAHRAGAAVVLSGRRVFPFRGWHRYRGLLPEPGWAPLDDVGTAFTSVLREAGYWTAYATDNTSLAFAPPYDRSEELPPLRQARRTDRRDGPRASPKPSCATGCRPRSTTPTRATACCATWPTAATPTTRRVRSRPGCSVTGRGCSRRRRAGGPSRWWSTPSSRTSPGRRPGLRGHLRRPRLPRARAGQALLRAPDNYLFGADREVLPARMRALYAAEVTMTDRWLGSSSTASTTCGSSVRPW